DLYGGTFRIFDFYESQYGIKFKYVDFENIVEIQKEMNNNTRAFFIEPVTNPSMIEVTLDPLYELAEEHGILMVIDNTFLTPYYNKHLRERADISIQSVTNYI